MNKLSLPKLIAIGIFVLLPFFAFYLGMRYQQIQSLPPNDKTLIERPTGFEQNVFMTQEECEQTTGLPCEQIVDATPRGWKPLEPTQTRPEDSSTQEYCIAAGGTYLAEYRECEGISMEACQESGGIFDECASACRHNPDPNAYCIQMCIPLCTYKQ